MILLSNYSWTSLTQKTITTYQEHLPITLFQELIWLRLLMSSILLDIWIADNDANQHMSHKFEWFTSYKPLSPATSSPITSVSGHKTYVASIGTICFLLQLPDRTKIFSLDNVLYVLGLDCNLFSTTTMAKKHGFIFIGSTNRCTFTKDNELYLTCR